MGPDEGGLNRFKRIAAGTGDVDPGFLADLRAGTRSAYDSLYRRFNRRVLASVAVIVGDPDDALDVTHDAFVKVFESAGTFEGEPAGLLPWLLAIARNSAVDHLRKSRRARCEEPAVIDRRCECAASSSPAWGDHSSVHAAVEHLSAEQRQVLMLRYRGGLDPRETGRALGKSVDSVRHIEQRALSGVRARLPGASRAAR